MIDGQTDKPAHKGPFFWVGLMFAAYGAIVALAMTEAVGGIPLLIMILVPTILFVPMLRAGKRAEEISASTRCFTKGEAQRRYLVRVAVFTSLYLISLGVMTFANEAFDLTHTVRFVLAALPGFGIVGIFWAIGRLIVEESDEFMRMLIIRQSLLASGLALSAASVWGFLEQQDIVLHIDSYWWAVVWFFGLAVGAALNRVQYGTWGAV